MREQNQSAGVSVKVAARDQTKPTATLGPVLENSRNLFVPINERPTITVPALVKSARLDRFSVNSIAPTGSFGIPRLAEPPRKEEAEVGAAAEQDAHEEQLDERRDFPAGQIHPGKHACAIKRLMPIVASGTSANQNERYTASKTREQRHTVAIAARSSEVCTPAM